MAELVPIAWSRMIRAVEKVRERLLRAARSLEAAGVPYAVVGGNAVAAWVSRVDESAVRNTRDVNILLRRNDLETARRALESVGFVYRQLSSLGRTGTLELFLDGPDASARDAIHLVFAGEKVHADNPLPSPDVAQAEPADQFRVVSLEALVQMKLAAYHDKDRTHLRDLIEVGLVDDSWLNRVEPELRPRLQHLLETPGG
jgi:hypothetical protein